MGVMCGNGGGSSGGSGGVGGPWGFLMSRSEMLEMLEMRWREGVNRGQKWLLHFFFWLVDGAPGRREWYQVGKEGMMSEAWPDREWVSEKERKGEKIMK